MDTSERGCGGRCSCRRGRHRQAATARTRDRTSQLQIGFAILGTANGLLLLLRQITGLVNVVEGAIAVVAVVVAAAAATATAVVGTAVGILPQETTVSPGMLRTIRRSRAILLREWFQVVIGPRGITLRQGIVRGGTLHLRLMIVIGSIRIEGVSQGTVGRNNTILLVIILKVIVIVIQLIGTEQCGGQGTACRNAAPRITGHRNRLQFRNAVNGFGAGHGIPRRLTRYGGNLLQTGNTILQHRSGASGR